MTTSPARRTRSEPARADAAGAGGVGGGGVGGGGGSAPRPPWGKVALVLAVIAGAHLAFFLLLTSAARSDLITIEARWTRAALVTAEEPGPRPSAMGEVSAWMRGRERWEDAQTWNDRRAFVRSLGLGLAGSFVLQAGLLAVVLHRSLNRRVSTRRRR